MLKKFFLLSLALLIIAPNALGQQRGYLMQRPCPFSCRTEGINKQHCRDWREGNTCYVEDLSRRPQAPAAPAAPRPPAANSQTGFTPWGGSPYPANDREIEKCRSDRYIARPRINVYRAKPTGNFFGDKLKVRGEIEGVCLAEAGYFEAGRKRENIPVNTMRDFRRYEFEVTVRPSERPEVRVYNINGDMDYVQIDPREFGAVPGRGGW